MPPRFGWYDAEVYIPEKLTHWPGAGPAGFPGWFLVGRLKSGVSSQQAEADLTVIAKRLATIYPKDYPPEFRILVKHVGDTVIGRFAETLYTVLTAVGLLLLISCSNVANLMLARATTREKEFALRAAMGAGRARLIRLLMFESLVLALGGAALGVLIAWGGLKSLVVVMPQDLIPAETVIQLNGPALASALCMAILTPMIFGLAPALQSSRQDCNDALRDSGKGVSTGFRRRWFRDTLVVGEVALSLTLLIGAGLLMRSFVALRELNLGLRADHVLQTMLILPEQRYKTAEQVTRFFRPVLAQVKALPGVVDAAESSSLPYGGDESKMEIAGKTHTEDWQTLFQQVSQEYFRMLRIEVRRGRTFSEAEVNDARKVAVVNEMFVSKYLPKENPIGQHVRLANLEGVPDPSLEIIGLVGECDKSRAAGADRAGIVDAVLANLNATAGPRRANGSGSEDDVGRGPKTSLGHGFGSGFGLLEHSGGFHRWADVRGAAVWRRGDVDFWMYWTAAGDSRRLQRAGVLYGAEDARDRNPHGAGCKTRRLAATGGRSRVTLGRAGHRDRTRDQPHACTSHWDRAGGH
jgi:putative ABC transport system permease protein